MIKGIDPVKAIVVQLCGQKNRSSALYTSPFFADIDLELRLSKLSM